MGRRTDVLHEEVNGAAGNIVDYDWMIDAAGRITPFVSSVDGTRNCEYDATNQLTSEDDTGGSTNDRSYSYDENGNRTMLGYATGQFNRITASPTHTFAYDNKGRVLRLTTGSTGGFASKSTQTSKLGPKSGCRPRRILRRFSVRLVRPYVSKV